MRRLPRLAVDVSSLRESRDLRLLVAGNLVTGLGTQAALVALPFQLYTQTRSAFLTGLLGAVELVPLIVLALVGGAIADRFDRRRLLLLDQIALVVCAGALAAASFALDEVPVWFLYVIGGLLAGLRRGPERHALGDPPEPRPAGEAALGARAQLRALPADARDRAGPRRAADRRRRGGVGLRRRRGLLPRDGGGADRDGAAAAAERRDPLVGIRRSIGDGLRFVRGNQALMGSFAIDLLAMTFGMPRALFAVLAVDVYGAGASGTGLLYAAVSAGATVAALTTGWLEHARRLGLIVIWAVVVWGGAIAGAGLVGSLWPAAALLFVAGAADSVSAVCRSTINQTVTPDAMRGRMSSVFSLVVTSGPRLGDVEAGSVAGLTSPRFSVVSGGVACVAGVALILIAFPALLRYDAEEVIASPP